MRKHALTGFDGVRWIALACVVASHVQADERRGTVTGRVIDAETGERILLANVVVLGTTNGAMSNRGGTFVIRDIQPGLYEIQASHVGHNASIVDSVCVRANEAALADFYLERVPVSGSHGVSSLIQPHRNLGERELIGSVLLNEEIEGWIDLCVVADSGDPEWFGFAPDARQRSELNLQVTRTVGPGGRFKDQVNDLYRHSAVVQRDERIYSAVRTLRPGARVRLGMLGYHIVQIAEVRD